MKAYDVDFREGYRWEVQKNVPIKEITYWEMASCEFIEEEFIRDLHDLNLGEEKAYTELGAYVVFKRVA